jgi:hypothetical protein
MFSPCSTVKVDSAVLLEAELAKTTTELQTELLVLEEALVGVPTHLKVSPLLVDLLLDAINDLLDLLVLDMCLDQLATANSFGVAKDAGRSAKVVVGRRDIFGRTQDKTILGRGVPTRDSLAGDRFIAGGFDGEGPLLGHARLDVEVALRHAGGIASKEEKSGEVPAIDRETRRAGS